MKTRILLTVMLIFMSWQSVAMPHIEYEEDLDEVTAAVKAQEISPFIDLLAIIERDFNGRVIKVELEKDDDYSEDDMWIYEIKILDADRNVVKADFDAKTFRLLAIKGRKLERFFSKK